MRPDEVGRRLRWLPALAAAIALAGPARATDTAVVTVTAVILSRSNCRITTGNAAINLGSIDPSSLASVTRSAAMSLTCQGSAPAATFAITADTGLQPNASSTRRLRNAGDGTFMTYALAISPAAGTVNKGTPLPFSVDATLAPADFGMASAGTYSDTVTITLSP